MTPQRQAWHLDKGRRRPVLRVTRQQFPLAPGFATTAHAAQGQTYAEGVVMDMHIALTRVKDRQGLFLYRPFDATPYQKGVKAGRALLLRVWRGEDIDWSKLRAKYREERVCVECREQKPIAAYTAGQWKRTDPDRVCKECVRGHAEANQPWQCNTCKDWKEKDAFAQKYCVCATCEQTKRCDGCSVRKGQAEFTADAWRKCTKERLCKSCASKHKGFWTCCTCQGRKDIAAFQEWTESQASVRRMSAEEAAAEQPGACGCDDTSLAQAGDRAETHASRGGSLVGN